MIWCEFRIIFGVVGCMCFVYFDKGIGAWYVFAGLNHLFHPFNIFYCHKQKKEQKALEIN